MAITAQHTIYDNFVLENQFESNLTTQLDFNQFLTVDNSLTSAPGMMVKINKYTVGTGAVSTVAQGADNTNSSTVGFTTSTYTVNTYQGQFAVYDEQVMTDPNVLDEGLNGLAEDFANLITTDVLGEMAKATATVSYAPATTVAGEDGIDFDTIVDALAEYPFEDESGLYLVIGKAQLAEFRKNLGDNLKYVEDFVRKGYIGQVCGVPVYVSKAITDGNAYLGSPEAITYFNKKGVESEVKRDAGKRQSNYIMRKYGVTALTDARKIVKIVPAS